MAENGKKMVKYPPIQVTPRMTSSWSRNSKLTWNDAQRSLTIWSGFASKWKSTVLSSLQPTRHTGMWTYGAGHVLWFLSCRIMPLKWIEFKLFPSSLAYCLNDGRAVSQTVAFLSLLPTLPVGVLLFRTPLTLQSSSIVSYICFQAVVWCSTRRTIRAMLFIVLFSLLFNIPRCFEMKVTTKIRLYKTENERLENSKRWNLFKTKSKWSLWSSLILRKPPLINLSM